MYKIISENKNYFSACIEGKITVLEKFSERINNNDFEANEENRPEDTLHLLKFLSQPMQSIGILREIKLEEDAIIAKDALI